MDRYERARLAADRTEAIDRAIVDGMARAKDNGYHKPMDIALVVRVALREAGFRILPAPRA